jgi:polygalacturonase
MTEYDILKRGARGDGSTNDAAAIQAAIDACATAGGGRVVVPPGRVFRAGPVQLKSGVDLHLEHGARLEAIPDRSLYTEDALPPRYGGDGKKWIHAFDAEDIAISGTGTIDGRGVEFMGEELPHIYKTDPGRPFVITFEACKRVTIRDVTLRDSPFWNTHLAGCEDILISGIRLLNNLKIANADGIDPNRCRDLRIIGCHIVGGDDCICPKSEEGFERYGDNEDFVVSGCTMVSTSCAIKLGSTTYGGMRRFVFDNCIIKGSHRGIGLQHRDQGVIEDVLFSNMVIETRLFDSAWWGEGCPIYVTSFPRTPDTDLGTIRNVRFSNIQCRGESGVYVAAPEAGHIDNIAFDRVSLHIDKTSKIDGGFYDRRPGAADPLIQPSPTSGFHLESASDITVRDCRVTWGENPPNYYRHALYARKVEGLDIQDLRGESAFPEKHESILSE